MLFIIKNPFLDFLFYFINFQTFVLFVMSLVFKNLIDVSDFLVLNCVVFGLPLVHENLVCACLVRRLDGLVNLLLLIYFGTRSKFTRRTNSKMLIITVRCSNIDRIRWSLLIIMCLKVVVILLLKWLILILISFVRELSTLPIIERVIPFWICQLLFILNN